MGNRGSAERLELSPPDGLLRLSPECERQFLRGSIDMLREVVGSFWFKTGSWDSVQASLTRYQDTAVERFSCGLHAAHEAASARAGQDVSVPIVREIRLHVLKGGMGPELVGGMAGFWMGYSTRNMDAHGNVTSTTTVNAAGDGGLPAMPPLPSLQSLGIQEQIDRLKKDLSEAGNAYLYVLDLAYSYTQQPPDSRNQRWDSELVLLEIRLGEAHVLALQLYIGPVEADRVTVAATSLAGNELVSCSLRLQDCIGVVRQQVATQAQQPLRYVRLVLPDGRVIGEGAIPDSATVRDLLEQDRANGDADEPDH